MEILINLLFPQNCVGCNVPGSVICDICLSKCVSSYSNVCVVCGNVSFAGNTHVSCRRKGLPTNLFSCFEYTGLVGVCVKRSKYGEKEFSVLKKLTAAGLEFALRLGLDYEDFVVVPVPLSRKRLRERGFNQAEIIAKFVAKGFGLKGDFRCVRRIRGTKAQVEKNREERIKTMRGVFKADSKRVLGEKILLVDDVCTTGATLLSVSKALYGTGAKEVRCFTLARTPLMQL